MTRIETALTEMYRLDCGCGGGDHSLNARHMLATPTGQALAALVEAAEAWRYSGTATGGSNELEAAFDVFRAATEPR